MAPPYLTGLVSYDQDVGVVDVQTIIDNITALALAAVPAWTNPVAGKIISPLDSSGRQQTIQFTRIAATNLEMLVTDGAARTSTRRAQIAAGGSTVNYFVGQFHMVLDWLNGGTPEGLYSVMLDESPEVQTSTDRWLVMNGSRSVANALDGSYLSMSCFIVRSANTFAILLFNSLLPCAITPTNDATNGYGCRTLGGSNIWYPVIVMGDSTAALYKIYGKMWSCLVCKDTYNTVDTEVSVPVDQSNSVIMRVLNIPPFAPSGGVNLHDRMAVRKT